MRDVQFYIRKYLKEGQTLQIATSDNDQPWICTVWYVHDDDFNIYWISERRRRHSLELLKNDQVAGAIVTPHKPEDKVHGLQLEGFAAPVEAQHQARVNHLFHSKYPNGEHHSVDMLTDPKGEATFYKIRPRSFVLFDEVHYPQHPRQEWVLA